MAKKDKELLEAEKKLKAAEKKSAPKKEKTEKKAKGDKKKRRFGSRFKRFRGETKKITWPDGKTVLKSTGIVIIAIIVVGSFIWLVDAGLGFGLGQTLQLAAGRELGQREDVPSDPDLEDWLQEQMTQPAETTAAPDITEADEDGEEEVDNGETEYEPEETTTAE